MDRRPGQGRRRPHASTWALPGGRCEANSSPGWMLACPRGFHASSLPGSGTRIQNSLSCRKHRQPEILRPGAARPDATSQAGTGRSRAAGGPGAAAGARCRRIFHADRLHPCPEWLHAPQVSKSWIRIRPAWLWTGCGGPATGVFGSGCAEVRVETARVHRHAPHAELERRAWRRNRGRCAPDDLVSRWTAVVPMLTGIRARCRAIQQPDSEPETRHRIRCTRKRSR